MQGLGYLSGGNYSIAQGISGDGLTVVGYASNVTCNVEAFRWTQGTGMQGLGVLAGGTTSFGSAVNADGSVIAGYSDDASGNVQAIRWTQSTGMQGLGYLAGGRRDNPVPCTLSH